MIYKYLGGTPEGALHGTTVLNTIALMKGAHILRVHDVKAAREAILVTEKLKAMSEFSGSSETSETPTHNS
jgi:dihydropteroate synthase